MGFADGKEIELKLGLASPEDFERLLDELDPPRAVLRQENRFLDSTDGLIRAKGFVLRLRRETLGGQIPDDRGLVLTLKGDPKHMGALSERIEIESAVRGSFDSLLADPSGLLKLDLGPVAKLKELVPGLPGLRAFAGFTNLRRVYDVSLEMQDGGGRSLETVWEVDRISFPGGKTECEIEIELEDAASAPAVLAAARKALDRMGVKNFEQPVSKFVRCMKHLGA